MHEPVSTRALILAEGAHPAMVEFLAGNAARHGFCRAAVLGDPGGTALDPETARLDGTEAAASFLAGGGLVLWAGRMLDMNYLDLALAAKDTGLAEARDREGDPGGAWYVWTGGADLVRSLVRGRSPECPARRYERPLVAGPDPEAALARLARRPAVFFDRDGVLNLDHGYVHRREDFQWTPGAREAVKLANDAGAYAFVVTNQSGIARGRYHEADFHALTAWMQQELRSAGAHLDEVAFCPHHPEAGAPPYRRACGCRKPAPGMIAALAAAWPVELSRSALIGDKDSDLAAAAAAGIDGLRYTGGDLGHTVAKALSLQGS